MCEKQKVIHFFFYKRSIWVYVLCLLYSVNIFSQSGDRVITGNVSDLSGEPLLGATIRVEGGSGGAVADGQGSYELKVPEGKDIVLEFSYLGYITLKEKVGNRKLVNVILKEDVGQLDEVVVVGYGTQKKASVIGAITTIEPGKLNVGTTRSISNNLAGNLAGVIGVQRSGEPGFDNSEFWIRGVSTWGGGQNSSCIDRRY